jgi:hypothetical protein
LMPRSGKVLICPTGPADLPLPSVWMLYALHFGVQLVKGLLGEEFAA